MTPNINMTLFDVASENKSLLIITTYAKYKTLENNSVYINIINSLDLFVTRLVLNMRKKMRKI